MRRAAGIATLALVLVACSESVRVLESEPDDGPASGSTTPRLDAGLDAPDLPDPPSNATAGPTNEDPCGGCGAGELCTAEGCVASSGHTMVESGRVHTCLVSDGRLYCWGSNTSGQLGVGDQESRMTPARVGSDNDWFAVSGGELHTCGIRSPGELYCWGENSKGALGLGDTGKRLAPERVGDFDDWEALNCGGDNCCALRDGGRLYCWGDNHEGKPGQDDPFDAADVLVPSEVAGDARYLHVALGQGHVNAITMEGVLVGWGRNPMGEAGIGLEEPQTRAPLTVDDSAEWVSVGAAQHHSCAVRADGSLWCWGTSPFGELGGEVADAIELVRAPLQTGAELDWAAVAVGWFHTCAIKQDDSLYCWGRAIEGQLGQGGGDPIPKPTAIAPEQRWQLPVLGGFHTCALDGSGDLYCWGQNSGGQLGTSGEERYFTPQPVSPP